MSELDPPPSWVMRLGAIGDRPSDSESARLQHRLLVFMGALMSGGGLMWGGIASSQGLSLPAAIPYGYTVATAFNLAYFRASKNFAGVRFFQVLISLLLPFLFQWSLGGFGSSGAVMLWAMLAIVGSLTFGSARTSLGWLVLYLALTVLSGVLDGMVRVQFSPNPPEGLRTLFFVVNIVVISGIVFGLTIYLLGERERTNAALADANAQVTELNERLEDEVAARTAELASSLARTEAILASLADGLVAVDRAGAIQTVNAAMARLYGTPAGQKFDVLPVSLVELADRSMAAKAVERTEVVLPGDRIGAAVASPILTSDGGSPSAEGSVVILRDVTLEKEIDRMKTDFIATVSHELRTPLTSVLGFAKLTKNKLETAIFPLVPQTDAKATRAAAQIAGNIDIIVSEGQRLTSLINDVLDISKMEAGRMEWKFAPTDAGAVVKRAAEATAALFPSPAVVLTAEVEANLPLVDADADRLLQVLINLISNAAKFTEQGKVAVRAKRHRDGLELTVSDTGAGIAPSDQQSIFEKFKQVGDTLTNKPKGTGLGLPICRQIVTAHRGTIAVESEFGKGSMFRVVLPASSGGAMSGPSLATSASNDAEEGAGRTSEDGANRNSLNSLVAQIEQTVDAALPRTGADVLVVDDDPSLRELVRQQLSERGYGVRLAPNGTEAIHAIRQRRPDLVVLDIMMPDISGFDVAAVLKSDPNTQTIPILVLSIVHDVERGHRVGVDRYLTKPVDAEVLVREVQGLVRRERSPRRVLVVDREQPAASDVVRLLEAKGFEIVGSCTGQAAIEEARRTRPDLIIVESAPNDEVVRAIRLERDLEHVLVVSLVERARHGAA